MNKYLSLLAVLFLLSGVVSLKHEQYANKATENGGNKGFSVFLDNAPNSKDYSPDPLDNKAVWWERGYVYFGWPSGITIWALFLTMIVIAEQTMETRKAAKATEDSVAGVKRQTDLMEKTLILQFRPKIAVRSGEVQPSMVADVGEQTTGTFEFTIANMGGSEATNIKAAVQLVSMIRPPVQAFRDTELFAPFSLKAGRSEVKSLPLTGKTNEIIRWMDTFQVDGTGYGDARKVFFHGVVSYEDELGIERSMGFYRRYDCQRKRFVAVPDSDQEYSD